ncbi:hypothetical protein Cni_G21842 [Canna indica]|uniref:S-adenosyl-L-methionine-dependent methyltransferase superfamily protein n=1 Tax=Canna indica TaxID=4628 RepID=A0AAQ3KTX2_9LILI|nr:hypothetical protein Cni_G21842 [Canna indica]
MKPAPPQAATTAAAVPTLSQKLRGHIYASISFLLLLSLGYTLGLLSASPNSPPPAPLPSPARVKTSEAAAGSEVRQLALPPLDLLRFRTQCADPIPQSEVLKTILDRVHDGKSPFDGFPTPETAALLLPPKARPRGWGSTMPVFRDLIESVRPLTIIELGTFLGASALHMAAVAANLSLPAVILCVDDFRGWPGARVRFARDLPRPRHGDSLLLHQFMAGVAAAGAEAEGRIVPVPFSTASALAALCEWGVYGDLIEVDAGHDFHSAWADINGAWAVLRPGGVLFGHDYYTAADDHGVRRAVTLFARVNGVQVRPHGQHWVLSPKPNPPSNNR